MTRHWNKHGIALAAIAVASATLGLARIAQAGQSGSGDTIYRGDPKTISGITPRAWGSGVVTEDPSMRISGTSSVKIVTHGLYQGGSLVFGTPVNLNPYVGNKDAYLQFSVAVIANSKTAGGGGSGMMGMMSGPPGASMGGARGSGRSGGGAMSMMSGPGGSMGGGRGGAGGAVAAQKVRDIENLRVQMINTAGKATEFLLPMEYASTSSTSNWKTLSIPVAATGLKAGAAEIKEIRLFGDAPGTMNVGEIRTTVDATPINVDNMQRQTVGRNERRIYRVKATSGSVPLKVSWDFDASDGIQEEKAGRAVQHVYRKSGDYKVTVTVTDAYGLRAPKTITFPVFVP